MRDREKGSEEAYRRVTELASKEQRERVAHAVDVLNRLREAGIDVGAGYRLEHPFTRTTHTTRTKEHTGRSHTQNQWAQQATERGSRR